MCQIIRGCFEGSNGGQQQVLLGPRTREIAQLVPELRSPRPLPDEIRTLSDPESARFRLFGSVATFLRNAARIAPLLVVIDDLHYARWISRRQSDSAARLRLLEYQRLLDVDVTVREATEADAVALSDLERRCPIVMSDTSMTIDRATDYFAFTRLMEEAIVSVALVGGKSREARTVSLL